jgi:hydroxyacylglutathione hydrolase
MFNAGAGNCHNGGHPEELYDTFAEQLTKLPDDTLIYPGHDYISGNLAFTIDREPDNQSAKTLLSEIANQDPAMAMVTTLGLEKKINTFFRLQSPSVIAALREKFPDMEEEPVEKEVFLKLRMLRNDW